MTIYIKTNNLSKNRIIILPIPINNLIDKFLEISKDLIIKIFQKYIIYLITYENYLIINSHLLSLSNFYSNYYKIDQCLNSILSLPDRINERYFYNFLCTFDYNNLYKILELFNMYDTVSNLSEKYLEIYNTNKKITEESIINKSDFINNSYIFKNKSNINYFNLNCIKNPFIISLKKYLDIMFNEKISKLILANRKKFY